MQKIFPCLWFDDKAEEAAKFYVSIFKDSKISNISKYTEATEEVSGKPPGSVMAVEFQIDGQYFMALNGGPEFKFTPAISFVVNCESQKEVDNLWEKLTEDGEEMPCGWLTDKYGVTWQITPKVLDEMLKDKDPVKAERVMKAMLEMNKIDIEALRKAYNNE